MTVVRRDSRYASVTLPGDITPIEGFQGTTYFRVNCAQRGTTLADEWRWYRER